MVPDIGGEVMLASMVQKYSNNLNDWYVLFKINFLFSPFSSSTFYSPPALPSKSNIETRWIGEKYDGIRCIWNPRVKHLYPLILILKR